MNSTINLLQLFTMRKETRGAWMQIDDYVLADCKMPAFQKLNRRNRKQLLNTFKSLKNREFPSILEQLENKHPSRKLIDKTWLEILGYKGKTDQLLDQLYESLAKEIVILKEMMAEKT